MNTRELANKIIRDNNMSNLVTPNIVKLANNYDIKVYDYHFKESGPLIKSCITYQDDKFSIFVNEDLDIKNKRVAIAMELSRIFLDSKKLKEDKIHLYPIDDYKICDVYKDKNIMDLAVDLLIPDNSVSKICESMFYNSSISNLSNDFCVPVSQVTYKLYK